MTRGQEPDEGYFEVRPHLAKSVLAVFWVPRPGAAGELVNGLTFGDEHRLEQLGRAIALHLRRAAAAKTAGAAEPDPIRRPPPPHKDGPR